MNTSILILPGLGDSGEGHWQTNWLKKFPLSQKLIQENWNEPKLHQWLSRLNEKLEEIPESVILVAHSLAVSLVMHWFVKYPNQNVKGVLLVAPADVDSAEHTPEVVRNFSPMPLHLLPVPSTVIFSENDPFLSSERAVFFAEKWGSKAVNIGLKGHINAASELGIWEEGLSELELLTRETEASIING